MVTLTKLSHQLQEIVRVNLAELGTPGRLSYAPTVPPSGSLAWILNLECLKWGCVSPAAQQTLRSGLLFPPSGPAEDLCLHEVQSLPPDSCVLQDGHVGQQVGPISAGAGARSTLGPGEQLDGSAFLDPSALLLFTPFSSPPYPTRCLISPLSASQFFFIQAL